MTTRDGRRKKGKERRKGGKVDPLPVVETPLTALFISLRHVKLTAGNRFVSAPKKGEAEKKEKKGRGGEREERKDAPLRPK